MTNTHCGFVSVDLFYQYNVYLRRHHHHHHYVGTGDRCRRIELGSKGKEALSIIMVSACDFNSDELVNQCKRKESVSTGDHCHVKESWLQYVSVPQGGGVPCFLTAHQHIVSDVRSHNQAGHHLSPPPRCPASLHRLDLTSQSLRRHLLHHWAAASPSAPTSRRWSGSEPATSTASTTANASSYVVPSILGSSDKLWAASPFSAASITRKSAIIEKWSDCTTSSGIALLRCWRSLRGRIGVGGIYIVLHFLVVVNIPWRIC